MTISAVTLVLLFLATLIVATAATRLSIALSHRLDILDRPDPRKTHRAPVAYLGGLGMLLGFLVGLVLVAIASPEIAILRGVDLVEILLGAVAIFLVGFYDDVRPLPAVIKLGLQILVATAMWICGVRIEFLSFGLAGQLDVGLPLSLAVTVGWYIVLMNAINLVDGLDGLAGGISFLGALSLAGITLVLRPSTDVLIAGYLSALIAGATAGFLVYNWHPAKTFMGDGGSLLLGYLLATASLVGSTKTPTALALIVPMVALGMPVFEVVFSFFRRLLRGQHPFQPDRRHLHHRLLDLGLDHRRVVLLLLFFTAFLGINSVLLARVEASVLVFNVVFLFLGLILIIESMKYLERRRNGSADGG